MAQRFRLAVLATLAGLGAAGLVPAAIACSRVTWLGPAHPVITGRSMDWPYGFNSHFHVVPRGERLDGAGGVNPLRWTSRYGAVVVSGSLNPGGAVDGSFDGINERGLAAIRRSSNTSTASR